jgi:DNA mismatch endonuclease (patch repair protein)
MSSNKAKNTKPELTLRKALWVNGYRGYRVNYKKLPGHPDIAFIKKRVAIFIHGCFWHRCPYCDLPLPKNNAAFWNAKFMANKERDNRKKVVLEEMGWRVLTIWECELKDQDHVLKSIRKEIL